MTPKDPLSYHLTFKIGGIDLSIQSDLPLAKETFAPKFQLFRCQGSANDGVTIGHHCGLPKLRNWGAVVYHRAPWAIHKTPSSYIYKLLVKGRNESPLVAIFNKDHKKGDIYKGASYVRVFKKGNLSSLLCFPTDQILFAQLLADRGGMIFHGSGLILKEKGYLFVGHSEAGKSTIVKAFSNRAKILNDDRIIVREKEGRFSIYGTPWHGEVALVAADNARLQAVFFLNRSEHTKIQKVAPLEAFTRLYGCSIKPLITKVWVENAVYLCKNMAEQVPCYNLYFDKSGGVVELVKKV